MNFVLLCIFNLGLIENMYIKSYPTNKNKTETSLQTNFQDF